MNLRELALDSLLEIEKEGLRLNTVVHGTLDKYSYLPKQERAFYSRLTKGCLEWQIFEDYVIDQFSKIKVKKMKPLIRWVLRMGVYQAYFMDSVPESAICNEAVNLTRAKGQDRFSGFVNGLLRNILRHISEISFPDKKEAPVDYLSVTYSVPLWIAGRFYKSYGLEKAENILLAMSQEQVLSVRVVHAYENPKELEEVRKDLEKEGVKVSQNPYVKEGFYLEEVDRVDQLKVFLEGRITVQDTGAMLASILASPKENDLVIDLCAAPGGKSLHMADQMKGTGTVIARDVSEHKLDLIRENLDRTGIQNVTVELHDATWEDEKKKAWADVVMADLPCSGLGVLGKKQEIRYKMTKEKVEEIVALQKKILRANVDLLKPGGCLLYSTCTISPKENEKMAAWIQKELGLFGVAIDQQLKELLKKDYQAQKENYYYQFLPGYQKSDGFFVAKFRKN